MKQKKEQQIHIRVTDSERQKIINAAKLRGYTNTSKFIIDSTLDSIKSTNNKIQRIHTITLSPTLDYRIDLQKFNDEGKNSFTSSEREFLLGGRGINTSLVLKELNTESTAVHYSGGFTGSYIWDVLEDRGIEQYRIKSPTPTRINLNVYSNDKNFSLEQQSNVISEYGKEQLLNYANKSILKNDFVVVSGSYDNYDKNYIVKFLNNLKALGARIIINFPGHELLDVVKDINPELVLLDISNSRLKIKSKKDIFELIEKYVDIGAKHVAYIVDANLTLFCEQDKKIVGTTQVNDIKSIVGLRDAFIAGFIHNIELDIQERISWGLASQKAKSIESGSVSYKNILEAKEEVEINIVE